MRACMHINAVMYMYGNTSDWQAFIHQYTNHIAVLSDKIMYTCKVNALHYASCIPIKAHCANITMYMHVHVCM